MRHFILAALAAFSVLALAAASKTVTVPPYYFEITDGTTGTAPCDQDGAVAKCSGAASWVYFDGSHSLQCDAGQGKRQPRMGS